MQIHVVPDVVPTPAPRRPKSSKSTRSVQQWAKGKASQQPQAPQHNDTKVHRTEPCANTEVHHQQAAEAPHPSVWKQTLLMPASKVQPSGARNSSRSGHGKPASISLACKYSAQKSRLLAVQRILLSHGEIADCGLPNVTKLLLATCLCRVQMDVGGVALLGRQVHLAWLLRLGFGLQRIARNVTPLLLMHTMQSLNAAPAMFCHEHVRPGRPSSTVR